MFTLVFSVPLLFSIIYLQLVIGSTNFFFLAKYVTLTLKEQKILCLFFFIAFAVKTPLFPVHIWLPEAHVEAPTVGSVILAALLLKLGIYGILRFCLNLFPNGVYELKPFFLVLCVLGCIFSSFLALSQQDIKKIIAYSSVAHMSLAVIGLLSNNIFGIIGGIILAIGHTFVSSALFILVGILYERYHSRIVDYYAGLSSILPIFSFFFFCFAISNFAFPISGNFIGEFLIFISVGFLNV
jgi:NADH:ubiquinone oxidoreductase subunit 4 (subunit M)